MLDKQANLTHAVLHAAGYSQNVNYMNENTAPASPPADFLSPQPAFCITIAMFSLSQKKRKKKKEKKKSQCCFGTNSSACWAETNTSDKIRVKWGHFSVWDFTTNPQKHSRKMARQRAERAFFSPCLLTLSYSLLFANIFFFLSFYFMPLLEISWKTKKPCVVTWHAYCTGVVGISGAWPSRHGCTGN